MDGGKEKSPNLSKLESVGKLEEKIAKQKHLIGASVQFEKGKETLTVYIFQCAAAGQEVQWEQMRMLPQQKRARDSARVLELLIVGNWELIQYGRETHR